jgi:glyoxylase-like metal-dependent hydrolase (beta-lactamase superfamily II)
LQGGVRPEAAGVRPIQELAASRGISGAGEQLKAIREGGRRFRDRFKAAGEVVAARTCGANRFPWPKDYAFFRAPVPDPIQYVVLHNRIEVIRFRQNGQTKTLLFNPIIGELGLQAPGFARLSEKIIEIGMDHPEVLELPRRPLERLAEIGLAASDIDYVAFDHLHAQDLRPMLGTTEPVPGFSEVPYEPMYPNAVWLLQRRELEMFSSMHPIQRPWFVADGLATVRTEQVCVVDGDFELGEGVAFLFTPGHTAGNQSLVLATPRGVFTLSENGVAPDSYNPRASKIPGLREAAERDDWECIVNGNAIESLVEQYTSMVKEKSVADSSAKHGDFFNTYQSSQMIVSSLSPGIEPAFAQDELDFGDWTPAMP